MKKLSTLVDHLLFSIAMKELTAILWLACLIIAGCTSKELSREEAFQLIREDQQYPRVVDYDIYCSDPQHARAALDAGLEKEGLVTVLKTQKLGDVGKPLIEFTSKAQPYLLATSPKNKETDIQKVKLAEEELVEVTDITTESDGKSAVVEYSTAYKNVTPFTALQQSRFQEKMSQKAYFSLEGNTWKLEKGK